MIYELLFVLGFITVAAMYRLEYAELIVSLQSGDPSVIVYAVPTVFKLVLSSMLVYTLLYAVTRYLIWRKFHKVNWRYLMVQCVFVLPFYWLIILLVGAAIISFQVLTSLYNDWVILGLHLVFGGLLYAGLVLWLAASNALSTLGKNPVHNLYDAFDVVWSKRGRQGLIIVALPIITSVLSVFNVLDAVYVPIVLWLSYLFLRQFYVSKKATIKAYLHFLWHGYTKKCKTVYKKVIKG